MLFLRLRIAKIKGFTQLGPAYLDVDDGQHRWRTDWLLKES